jgi:hypothetical protein
MTTPLPSRHGPMPRAAAADRLAAQGMPDDETRRVLDDAAASTGPVCDPALPPPFTSLSYGQAGYTLGLGRREG